MSKALTVDALLDAIRNGKWIRYTVQSGLYTYVLPEEFRGTVLIGKFIHYQYPDKTWEEVPTPTRGGFTDFADAVVVDYSPLDRIREQVDARKREKWFSDRVGRWVDIRLGGPSRHIGLVQSVGREGVMLKKFYFPNVGHDVRPGSTPLKWGYVVWDRIEGYSDYDGDPDKKADDDEKYLFPVGTTIQWKVTGVVYVVSHNTKGKLGLLDTNTGMIYFASTAKDGKYDVRTGGYGWLADSISSNYSSVIITFPK